MTTTSSPPCVLITGASSGIGLACARRFEAAGATVITAQRRACKQFDSIDADFSEPTIAEFVIQEVIGRKGQLDVLINNAGIMTESTLANTATEEWQRVLNVNLTAPALLIRHALPYLKKSTHPARGVIVNIGSIEGLASNPEHPAYCASKAGLHALTRAVAVDHGQDRIRCNAVAPGWIDTEINQKFVNQREKEVPGFVDKLQAIHPVGRTGTPDDVANLVYWLATTDADFITGQVLTIDGGRTAKLSLPL